ncbi:pectinesterase family protein [uncultured Ruminococcus sp.]|uniref:pectinesterase family protein n=1 Tax=uncultured Ruminococcus sp. TaxID=165186 RepID=UPI000EE0824C|nr:pectinesterase family protein [uncultured Ruminococcus sp.]HCJ41584.1 pectin esterase [Ruminococcus sp.]
MKEIILSPTESLADALAKVRPHTRLVLAPRVYREKVEICTPDIELAGSADRTRIVYGDYAKKKDEKGVEYNTFRTYTAAVLANDVRFKDLTVENDAGSPEIKGQEVALSIVADGFSAENCNFLSTQDTVFCGPLPDDLIARYKGFLKDELRASGGFAQRFTNCLIAGNVDFIFGCGDALFENCEIRSVRDVRGGGFTAAPAHALSQQTGFVFDKCRFTRENGVADGAVFLARPWRDYGKCSFIGCTYDSHISPEGFDKWNDTERDKTARFAEYGNIPAGRVGWAKMLTADECGSLMRRFA